MLRKCLVPPIHTNPPYVGRNYTNTTCATYDPINIRGRTTWPTHCPKGIKCMHCTHPFDGRPCCLPTRPPHGGNGPWTVFGCFCSWSCAKRYGLDMAPPGGDLCATVLLNELAALSGHNGHVHAAPCRLALRDYGGPMTIEQFRMHTGGNVEVLMPPFVAVRAVLAGAGEGSSALAPAGCNHKQSASNTLIGMRRDTVETTQNDPPTEQEQGHKDGRPKEISIYEQFCSEVMGESSSCTGCTPEDVNKRVSATTHTHMQQPTEDSRKPQTQPTHHCPPDIIKRPTKRPKTGTLMNFMKDKKKGQKGQKGQKGREKRKRTNLP